MADTDTPAPGAAPAGAAETPGDAAEAPPVAINVQYIRDFSFENPNAPHVMAELRAPPRIDVKVDVKIRNLAERVFEVCLSIAANATAAGASGERAAFVVELDYAGVVTVQASVPEEHLGPILLIEVPRLLFPFAREIVATATRDGGYPPLLLNPIDFAELYQRQQQAQQPAQGTA